MSNNIKTAKPASIKKTASQSNAPITRPPTVGAIIGATPIINMSVDSTSATCFFSNKSRTIAFEATMPAQPPKAIKNRAVTRISNFQLKAQIKDEKMNKVSPPISGRLLPNLSINGP